MKCLLNNLRTVVLACCSFAGVYVPTRVWAKLRCPQLPGPTKAKQICGQANVLADLLRTRRWITQGKDAAAVGGGEIHDQNNMIMARILGWGRVKGKGSCSCRI